jgi:RimJ/RimL family protein N-acetyltransferase
MLIQYNDSHVDLVNRMTVEYDNEVKSLEENVGHVPLHKQKNGRDCLVQHNGYEKPIGFVSFSINKKLVIVHKMYIDKEHRGQGYGTDMYNGLIAYLKSRVRTFEMTIETNVNSEESRKFLKSLGFIETTIKSKIMMW